MSIHSESHIQSKADITWPGFDSSFRQAVEVAAQTPRFCDTQSELACWISRTLDRPSEVGLPECIRPAYTEKLTRFAEAYRRGIERIIRAWRDDERIRRVVRIPLEFAPSLVSQSEWTGLQQFRIDLMTEPDGGFKALETNANCPGGLILSGVTGRRLRRALASEDVSLAPPLAYEDKAFLARWFLDVAKRETGERPERVALIRSGNSLELPEFAFDFEQLGVTAVEIDPREIQVTRKGTFLDGQPLRHAYWKLGIQELRSMSNQIKPLLHAIGDGTLFIQNGLPGRLIGDNKLCLAVLSDPAFEDLFSPQDLDILRPHIPWSRNAALLDAEWKQKIQQQRHSFVLKRGFDTRSRSVVLGQQCTRVEWSECLKHACRRGWLVQEMVEGTSLTSNSNYGMQTDRYHDLALGVLDGRIQVAFMRSSPDPRVNVFRSGRIHPVLMTINHQTGGEKCV